jgi:hypothetical protein
LSFQCLRLSASLRAAGNKHDTEYSSWSAKRSNQLYMFLKNIPKINLF